MIMRGRGPKRAREGVANGCCRQGLSSGATADGSALTLGRGEDQRGRHHSELQLLLKAVTKNIECTLVVQRVRL